MFVRQVVPGEFSQAEKTAILGIVSNPILTQLLKKHVVRVRHGFRQVHILAAPNLEHGVAGDDVSSRAAIAMVGLIVEQGMLACAKRDFLIYYREDAAGVRINRDRPLRCSGKSGNRGGAKQWIIVSSPSSVLEESANVGTSAITRADL